MKKTFFSLCLSFLIEWKNRSIDFFCAFNGNDKCNIISLLGTKKKEMGEENSLKAFSVSKLKKALKLQSIKKLLTITE
jgi:hypothetical protein